MNWLTATLFFIMVVIIGAALWLLALGVIEATRLVLG